jgi:hypothetical protein
MLALSLSVVVVGVAGAVVAVARVMIREVLVVAWLQCRV